MGEERGGGSVAFHRAEDIKKRKKEEGKEEVLDVRWEIYSCARGGLLLLPPHILVYIWRW